MNKNFKITSNFSTIFQEVYKLDVFIEGLKFITC